MNHSNAWMLDFRRLQGLGGFGRSQVAAMLLVIFAIGWNKPAKADNAITTPSSLSAPYQLTANTTVSGTGVLSMTGNPSGPTGAQFGTDGNSWTLTVQSGIAGSGLIGSSSGALYANLNLNNLGTMNANMSTQSLTIGGDGTSITNSGTFEATSGGILNLATVATIADGGGSISAIGAGSTVNIGTDIQGGTLSTSSGGVMQTAGTATLDASTAGAITLTDGSTYTAASTTLTAIKGSLNLGTTTGATFSLGGSLQLIGGTTFSGPGNLTLTGGQIGGDGTNRTLTNQSLIQGSGLFGSNNGALYSSLSLNNVGTINANQSGQSLTIGGTGTAITNSGTFEATGGGVLNLSTAAAIANVGGHISATGAGSTVNISTTIQGGTLSSSSGGVMQSSGTPTLDASTSGAITLTDGSTYTASSDYTSITGTLNLGTSTGATLALSGQLRLVGDTTFAGVGTVTMTAGEIGGDGNSRTLNNPNLIQGSGVIGSNTGALYSSLSLNNTGTINANQTGQVLSIISTGNSITNSGTFEATIGGTLNLATSSAISNGGGKIAASGNGIVNISTTIQGGTLSTSSAGTMQTSGPTTLDALTAGAITLSDGSTFTSTSSNLLSITGTIKLGTSTGSTFALQGQMRLVGDTTFSGPGNITMTNGQIGGDGSSRMLTNDNTIQGYGLIGSNIGALYSTMSLNNVGTINANQSGQVLTIAGNGTSITSTGTLEATNGGILDLTSSTPVSNGGGTISASGAGSTVNITTTIQGGKLSTASGGGVQTSGNTTLDGATVGAITITDGSTFTATGANNITGTLNLGTSTGATFNLGGQLRLVGNTTFAGPGTLILLPAVQIGTDGSNRTLTNQATIQGAGLLGSNIGALYNSGSVSNQGHLIARGGTLTIGETDGLTNTGTVAIDADSTLAVSDSYTQPGGGTLLENIASASTFSTMSIGTTASLNGTLDVMLQGGFVPTSGEVFTVMTFGSETGTFSSVQLLNDPGQSVTAIYEPTDVKIQFVPEPSSLLMLSCSMLALVIRPRRCGTMS